MNTKNRKVYKPLFSGKSMKKISMFAIATILAAIVLMGFVTGAQGFGATDFTNKVPTSNTDYTNKQTQANKVLSSIVEKKTNDAQEASGGTVDIAVTHLVISPDEPKINDNINVIFTIKNLGDHVEEVNWGYTVDGPSGGFGSGGCCITLHPDESHELEFYFVASEAGEYTVNVNAWPENSEDQDPSNNKLSLTFNVRDIILLIGDFDGNEIISTVDLLALLGNWGTNSALYDEDGSGVVDRADLQMLLANWGEGRMLRGDIVHLGVLSHCRINSEELTIVLANIGNPMDNYLSRLADLDNDGHVTEKDVELMIIQADLSQSLGYGTSYREDLNCNGVMDNKDAKILNLLWGPKDYNDTWADVNGDGTVNVLDLLELLASPGWN